MCLGVSPRAAIGDADVRRRRRRRRAGLIALPFTFLCLPPTSQMAPTKKGEKKKGRSAINEVVTREYTINIHKRIHGV